MSIKYHWENPEDDIVVLEVESEGKEVWLSGQEILELAKKIQHDYDLGDWRAEVQAEQVEEQK